MCTPQGIIDQLGSLAFCEAVKAGKYVLHYEKNLKKLQDKIEDLDVRRDCIEIKVREAIHGGEEIMPDVKNWQRKAEDMKTDVDKLIRQSTVKGNMHCIACSCPNIKWRYRLSKQAEQKILVVKELTEKGHFDEISHPRPPPPELEFPSDENFLNLDSRKPIFNNIVDALKDSTVNTIGVLGPGGVGKTTLVMEVGKKMGHDGYFKQVSLATIPKGRRVEEIQSQLADGLNFNFDPTKGSRKVQLWNKLTNGDKYLIILDDIWEKVDFKAIGIPITNEKRSCKVLLTSRNRDLLLITMEVQKKFSILELPDAEAWDLFKKKVGNSFESRPELNNIGHKVCKKCKGLPVAINAIGAALKNKADYAWNDALIKLERYELMDIVGIDTSVWASLRLSYDLLEPESAKSFFLLCCLFREDAEIPIGDLTRHCLARRLFSQDPRTVEEVRNSVCTVIDALKSASLLSNGSHENVVTIHDIIRDVGISIAREENAFFVEQGALHWPKNGPSYSAISLTSGKIQALPTELTCPKLHTLMFENSELSDLKVPDEFFSEMTELSVLILTRMRMRQLPSSLGKLAKLRMLYLIECHLTDIAILGDLNKNLEFLSLRGSSIKELPPNIGQLTSLLVLDLEECYELNVIPRGVVSNLTNLEELYFPSTFSEWEAATDKKHDTSSSNNVSLEELRRSLTSGQLTVLHIYIPDANLLPKEGLKFGNLERFSVSVGCVLYTDFSRTKVFKYEGISLRNEFIPLVNKAEVLSLTDIKGLKKMLHDRRVRNGFLDFTSCGDDLEYHLGEPKSSVESHGQNPSQSFNKLIVLHIKKCKLKYLFSPTIVRGLVHLEKLKVSSCEIMEGIVGFEEQNDVNEHVGEVKFDKLKRLKLEDLPNLISFYAKKEKTRITMGSSSAHPLPLFNEKVIFPILERLDIIEMGNLIEIWDKQSIAVLEEQGSFCQLMAMNVEDCAQLTNVFPSKMHSLITNLKELQVEGCGNMKGIVEFEGEIDEGLKDVIRFSKLTRLELSVLPSLVSFCTKLGTVGTTHSNATILFNEKVIFPILERLAIREMGNLTEIWDKQSTAVLKEQGSFCQLMDMNVSNCAQLTHVFPSKMHALLKNLKELRVKGCGIMKGIVEFEGEIEVCFNQLSTLSLEYLPNLVSFCTNGNATILAQPLFNEKVAFPALEKLSISGVPNITEIWDKKSLPESEKETQSFCKLRGIHICDCNQLVYVLPCYMLPQLQINLQRLVIWRCDEVEVIVSKELKEKEATDNEIIVFQQLKELRFGILRKLKRFYTGTELLFSHKVAFPSLERLTIDVLPKIIEIWPYKQPLPEPGKEAESFYKLSYIHVRRCDELVYLFPFYILHQLQHLEKIMIISCEKLEVIVSKELKEKEEIHNDIVFPQLKDVSLQRLPNLKRICSETQLFFSDKHAFPVLKNTTLLDEGVEFLRNGTSTKKVSMQECSTSGKEIETLPKGTSTKEECGTNGKENDANGEED